MSSSRLTVPLAVCATVFAVITVSMACQSASNIFQVSASKSFQLLRLI